MRTPWPNRSAPQICTASQIDGGPNASPAWMVKNMLFSFSSRNAFSKRDGG